MGKKKSNKTAAASSAKPEKGSREITKEASKEPHQPHSKNEQAQAAPAQTKREEKEDKSETNVLRQRKRPNGNTPCPDSTFQQIRRSVITHISKAVLAEQAANVLSPATAPRAATAESSDQPKGDGSVPAEGIRVLVPPPKNGIYRPLVPNVAGLDKKKAFKFRRLAVLKYAIYLGMDPDYDNFLLFIADEGLFAPVPAPWSERIDSQGNVYYLNHETKTAVREHPLDEKYRAMYLKMCNIRPKEEKDVLEKRRQEAMEAMRLENLKRMESMPREMSQFEKFGRRLGIITFLLLAVCGIGLFAYNVILAVWSFDTRGPWMYQIVALMGSVDAQIYVGATFMDGVGDVPLDPAAAWSWFVRANETGHPSALRMMGLYHYKGKGVETDYVEAGRLFLLAAKKGDAPSKAFAGYMYYKGQGLPVDYLQAVTLTREAADAGDFNGAFNLAMIYQEGLAVTRNYGNAYMWYLIASYNEDMKKNAQPQLEWLKPRLRTGDEQLAYEGAKTFRKNIGLE